MSLEDAAEHVLQVLTLAELDGLETQAQRPGCRDSLLELVCSFRTLRSPQHGHARKIRHRVPEKLQALASQLAGHRGQSRHVLARASKAGDEPGLNGLTAVRHNNGGGGRYLFRR